MNNKLIFFLLSTLFTIKLSAGIKVTVVPTAEPSIFKKTTQINIVNASKTILKNYKNPQIVIWFSGENDLTMRCFNFYNKLFSALANNKQNSPYNLYLYDLYSWIYLKKNKETSTTELSESNISIAFKNFRSKLKYPWVIVDSTSFFKWINSMTTLEINQTKQILSNKNIWKKSEKYPDNNIKIDNLNLNNNAFNDWFKIDTAKTYSAFQYLEGIFFIKKIVKKNLKKINNNSNNTEKVNKITIIFLLPQNESEYYVFNDKGATFATDIEAMLATDSKLKNECLEINIVFQRFDYNAEESNRPYLWNSTKDILLSKEQIEINFQQYCNKK